jgi:hypothetical protein
MLRVSKRASLVCTAFIMWCQIHKLQESISGLQQVFWNLTFEQIQQVRSVSRKTDSLSDSTHPICVRVTQRLMLLKTVMSREMDRKAQRENLDWSWVPKYQVCYASVSFHVDLSTICDTFQDMKVYLEGHTLRLSNPQLFLRGGLFFWYFCDRLLSHPFRRCCNCVTFILVCTVHRFKLNPNQWRTKQIKSRPFPWHSNQG